MYIGMAQKKNGGHIKTAQIISTSDISHRIQPSATNITEYNVGRVGNVYMYNKNILNSSLCNCSNLVDFTANYSPQISSTKQM